MLLNQISIIAYSSPNKQYAVVDSQHLSPPLQDSSHIWPQQHTNAHEGMVHVILLKNKMTVQTLFHPSHITAH